MNEESKMINPIGIIKNHPIIGMKIPTNIIEKPDKSIVLPKLPFGFIVLFPQLLQKIIF